MLNKKVSELGPRGSGEMGYFVDRSEAMRSVLLPGYTAILEEQKGPRLEFRPVTSNNLKNEISDNKDIRRVFVMPQTIHHQIKYTALSRDDRTICGSLELHIQPDISDYKKTKKFMKGFINSKSLFSNNIGTKIQEEKIKRLISTIINQYDAADLTREIEDTLELQIGTTIGNSFCTEFGIATRVILEEVNNPHIEELRKNDINKRAIDDNVRMAKEIESQKRVHNEKFNLAEIMNMKDLQEIRHKAACEQVKIENNIAEEELNIEHYGKLVKKKEHELAVVSMNVYLEAYKDPKVLDEYVENIINQAKRTNAFEDEKHKISLKELVQKHDRKNELENAKLKHQVKKLEVELEIAEIEGLQISNVKALKLMKEEGLLGNAKSTTIIGKSIFGEDDDE